MPLVRAGQVVHDNFTRLADDAPAPDNAAVLVPAARFLADAAEFTLRTAPTGVIWPNNRDVAELAPHLDRLALVALVFPSFRDGRAYSQARLLRERYAYGGEMRATGQVLRDQFVLLARAGFDAFEVAKDADARAFSEAVARYSVFYQPVGTNTTPILQRRLAARRGRGGLGRVAAE
jgi:uncharacterized protein (DUF934 family)